MFELSVFIFLYLFFLASAPRKNWITKKSLHDWILDVPNLWMQGILIPLGQTLILFQLLKLLFPGLQSSVQMSFWLALFINLVVVDYLYYWNHRLFHRPRFWFLHKIHHSMTKMDVLGTSRNTLWSSFFIVYLWINSILIFLLEDPKGIIIGVTITASLDLWRHSNFFNNHPIFQRVFSRYLGIITPIDHAWHHSRSTGKNYGANFNFFDRIHGTYEYHESYPQALGIPSKLPLWKKLLYPFEKSRS